MFAGRFALPSKHPRQLGNAAFSIQNPYLGNASSLLHTLAHHIMRVRHRGDLRQMRDANHLPLPGDLPHFFPYRSGRFPAHIGIHFIKDQDRNLIFSGKHRFERKHHAR